MLHFYCLCIFFYYVFLSVLRKLLLKISNYILYHYICLTRKIVFWFLKIFTLYMLVKFHISECRCKFKNGPTQNKQTLKMHFSCFHVNTINKQMFFSANLKLPTLEKLYKMGFEKKTKQCINVAYSEFAVKP